MLLGKFQTMTIFFLVWHFIVNKKNFFLFEKETIMKQSRPSSFQEDHKKFFKLMGNAILLASIQASIGSVDILRLSYQK